MQLISEKVSVYEFLKMVFDAMVEERVCSKRLMVRLDSGNLITSYMPISLSVQFTKYERLAPSVRWPFICAGNSNEVVGWVDCSMEGERMVSRVVVKILARCLTGDWEETLVFKMDDNTSTGWLHIEQLAKLTSSDFSAALNKEIIEGIKKESAEQHKRAIGLAALQF